MSSNCIDKKSQPPPEIANLLHDNLRLETEYIETRTIRLPERRLRKHPERQIVGLKASVSAFGIVAPLLIDASNVLIDGEAVLEAAKQLGFSSVPVVRLDHLSDEEVRKLRLALGKLATFSDWNQEELKAELIKLLDIESEVSIEVTGFELAEIDEIVSEPIEEEAEPDALPEPIEPGPAVSQLGDIWHLGEHKLMCGSSLDRENLEKLMDGERARMALTDAPYNVNIAGNVSGLGKKTRLQRCSLSAMGLNSLKA